MMDKIEKALNLLGESICFRKIAHGLDLTGDDETLKDAFMELAELREAMELITHPNSNIATFSGKKWLCNPEHNVKHITKDGLVDVKFIREEEETATAEDAPIKKKIDK